MLVFVRLKFRAALYTVWIVFDGFITFVVNYYICGFNKPSDALSEKPARTLAFAMQSFLIFSYFYSRYIVLYFVLIYWYLLLVRLDPEDNISINIEAKYDEKKCGIKTVQVCSIN